MNLKTIREYIWHSPTLTTWASYVTKSATFFIILPLILVKFDTDTISLWYIFVTIINLQILADIGFLPTFTRVIAYATAGADTDTIKEISFSKNKLRKVITNTSKKDINWKTIEEICAIMRVVYNRLTLLAVFFVLTVGTLFVYRPILNTNNPEMGFMAWLVIIFGSFFILRGNQYSAYLQGLDQIPLVKRWEAVMNLGSIISSYLVLIVSPTILNLVIVNQLWLVLNVLRNYILATNVRNKKYKSFNKKKFNRDVFKVIWPSSWRSGFGSFMGQIPIQFSGLVYAQFGSSGTIASYLLALNILNSIKNFSNAPFYSRIPHFAYLLSSGKREELLKKVYKSMRYVYWVFLFCSFTFGIFGEFILELIGSNAEFPDIYLWNALVFGALLERFGAMHLQFYTLSNKVVWHISNGVSAGLFILISIIFIKPFDVYAFPIGYIIAYLLFYIPFNINKSSKYYDLNINSSEKYSFYPTIVVFIIYSVFIFTWKG